MFKKLLSNLPFNPSLIGQVSFYAKRMHEEQRIRRLGLVFVALAFIVQMFAFISQPEPTLASSSNDIIYGGFASRDQAVLICIDGNKDFSKILEHFGVTCEILAGAETLTVASTDFYGQMDSMGRNPQGPVISRTGKQTDEYAVDTARAGRFYMRNLWAWDSGASSSYQMLKMNNIHGQSIMVMFKCGNIVTLGPYTPPPPPPPPPVVDVCKDKSGVQIDPADCDVCPAVPGIQLTRGDCDVCPLVPGTQSNEAECKPCDESQSDKDTTACLILAKAAKNNTQNIANADGTMAEAGDSITYTLSVKNNGKITVKDFVVEENVADISDYADITDLNGAKQEGYMLRWPKTDISPGETVKKQLVVKIKSPIPRTPISASDPARYDLVMNNVYGNAINIKLPPDVIKVTETVTKTLPNTGPGESMAAIIGITIFASYFFARSRLFAKELDIVRADYTTTGGY